jgi:hypothetical protein
VALVAADPTSCRELARLVALEGKTWNTPALAGNQLFVRNHTEIACCDLPGEEISRPCATGWATGRLVQLVDGAP